MFQMVVTVKFSCTHNSFLFSESGLSLRDHLRNKLLLLWHDDLWLNLTENQVQGIVCSTYTSCENFHCQLQHLMNNARLTEYFFSRTNHHSTETYIPSFCFVRPKFKVQTLKSACVQTVHEFVFRFLKEIESTLFEHQEQMQKQIIEKSEQNLLLYLNNSPFYLRYLILTDFKNRFTHEHLAMLSNSTKPY